MKKLLLTKKYRVAIIILTGASATACYKVAQWANQPASQTIQIQNSATVASATSIPKTVQTEFYTTKVPEHYRTRTSESPTQPDFIQSLFFDTKPSGKQVGITVNLLPPDGLKGVADYNYRDSASNAHRPFEHPGLPPGAKAFQSAVGDEISIFMTRGKRYASITVSAPNATAGQLLELLNTVVLNWHWR